MKRLLILLTLLAFTATISYGNVSKYKVNDAAIEVLFQNSIEQNAVNSLAGLEINSTDFGGVKKPIVAGILCWTLGYFGVHRFYLGAKPIVGIGYILTGGGCYIVYMIDSWVLLFAAINNDISKYVNNNKFFMW